MNESEFFIFSAVPEEMKVETTEAEPEAPESAEKEVAAQE
jgi:hypothetical protein